MSFRFTRLYRHCEKIVLREQQTPPGVDLKAQQLERHDLAAAEKYLQGSPQSSLLGGHKDRNGRHEVGVSGHIGSFTRQTLGERR